MGKKKENKNLKNYLAGLKDYKHKLEDMDNHIHYIGQEVENIGKGKVNLEYILNDTKMGAEELAHAINLLEEEIEALLEEH